MKNNAVRVLLAIVIAFALWTYVITVVSPNSEDTFYNISVNLRGESVLNDRGLMITSDEIPKVSMKLSGNRTDLNKITNENITLVADLSAIDQPGTQTLSYSYAFPGNVADDAITVLERSPSRITLTIERMISKDVPVTVRYTGTLSEDYIADKENLLLTDANNVVLQDNSVRVTGPESVINQISQAMIDVDLDGRSASFSEAYRYTLCDKDDRAVDAEHVTTELAEIYVTLYIQKVKEIPLNLVIIDGGGATSQTSHIEYEPKTIKVAANETTLADLKEYVLGTINLGELAEDSEQVFPIELPVGVTNLTGVTEVKVTVQFPKLLTKTLTVTNVVAANVPAGMEADIVTKELSITVRGPKELVEKITAEDITASIDFTNAQAGTFTTKANIIMSGEFAGVGAMGTYNMTATMREKAGSNG